MSTTMIQGIALIVMLLSMPLISWGTYDDIPAVTIGGSIILAVGMAALTVLRYIDMNEES